MTQDYPKPIAPPPELVQQWVGEIWHEGTAVRVALSDEHIATRAAQWGADRELEACCEWLASKTTGERRIPELRDARRPKPPSLKEQALQELEELRGDANSMGMGFDAPAIRRALEQLDD
jgi:hypothetical protein